MTLPDSRLYGIWIKKIGWAKSNGSPLAFASKDVAQSVANRLRNARVEYIDKSLEYLETQLLEEERQKMNNVWYRKIIRSFNGILRRST